MSKLKAVLRRFSKKYGTILVTGGAGAIGSNLVRHLLDSSVKKVVIIDNLSSGYRSNIPTDKRVIFIKGDIANLRVVEEAFKKAGKVDVVFHLAAHFANQNSVDHPVRDLASNGTGTINLLDQAVKHKVKKFVYFSTSCMYRSKKDMLKESDLDLQFDTPYAITKYMGEKYVHFYHEFHGLPTVTLRIFSSFGPGEKAGLYRNVIPNFFYKAMRGESLVITGTGRETRNFTYVGDVIRAALLAALSDQAVGKTINIGSDRSISIKDLATAINKLTGNRAKIAYTAKRKWDKSPTRVGDLELAKSLIDFEAEMPFEDGLLETHRYFLGEI